jgi:hypothetical protein
MALEFNLVRSYILAAWVFVPLFVIALLALRSARRALVLALTVTIGAAAGYLAALAAGPALMRTSLGAPPADAAFIAFAALAATAGGVLAVYLLGRFSKSPPWRRS